MVPIYEGTEFLCERQKFCSLFWQLISCQCSLLLQSF